MSGKDIYRFTISNGQITNVYEFDDGRWEAERIDANETYTLDGDDVIKTENERSGQEVSRYATSNGIDYFQVSETYRPYSTASDSSSGASQQSSNNTFRDNDDDINDDDDSAEYVNGQYVGDSNDDDDSSEYANGRYVGDSNDDDDSSEYANGQYVDDSNDDDDSAEYVNGRYVGDSNDDDDSSETYYLNSPSSSDNTSDSGSSSAPATLNTYHPERKDMGDFIRAYDIEEADSAGGIYRIYEAAFDRTPDMDGLGYWIAQADKGMSALDIAKGFVYSEEFSTKYGVTLSDDFASNADVRSVVNQMYRNVLDRDADEGGLEFYSQSIEMHERTVSRVLAEIADSSENRVNLVGVSEIDYHHFEAGF